MNTLHTMFRRKAPWALFADWMVPHVLLTATVLVGLGSSVRAKDILNNQVVGGFSFSFFDFPGPSACSRIFVVISATSGVSKFSVVANNAEAKATVDATFILVDNCSGIYQTIANGFAQFPGRSVFQISSKEARINASFVIKDTQTQELIPVVINEVCTAVGDKVFSEKTISHNIGPDFIFHSRFIGDLRSAIPSGTITFGTTTYDVSQAGYSESSFGSSNSGLIVISHQ
jgi:hypothetical protein